MDQADAQFQRNASGPWTTGPPNGNAFVPFTLMFNESHPIIANTREQKPAMYLEPNTDPHVIAGYAAQHRLMSGALVEKDRAASEILNDNYGGFSLSSMRPCSRGSVKVCAK